MSERDRFVRTCRGDRPQGPPVNRSTRNARVPALRAGTDAGEAAHHCTVIDTDGTKLFSRRVPNNEAEVLKLTGDVSALLEDDPATWAVGLNAGHLGISHKCV
ncbi:transposase [Streptomyces sp. NPDC048295]|uniref:IS110 family transposase n=1 Tax=Streptomyces sp. NPDC048295 TaxID=3154617 RepID=UPI00342DC8AA